MTKKGAARGRGSQLSSAGVELARRVGGGLGPVDVVLTSAAPRAVETALAMGFAVDDTAEMPSGYVPGEVAHHDQWRWARPYVRYAELIAAGGGLAAAAWTVVGVWRRAVLAVPDGGCALVVGHGGTIEPALVACLPDAAHASWGAPFAHCDGARLGFEGGRFVGVTVRRVV